MVFSDYWSLASWEEIPQTTYTFHYVIYNNIIVVKQTLNCLYTVTVLGLIVLKAICIGTQVYI